MIPQFAVATGHIFTKYLTRLFESTKSRFGYQSFDCKMTGKTVQEMSPRIYLVKIKKCASCTEDDCHGINPNTLLPRRISWEGQGGTSIVHHHTFF